MCVLAYCCQEGGFHKMPNKLVPTNCCRFLVVFVLHVAAVELVSSGCLFVGGQITLFSAKRVLDTGWKWYAVPFHIPLEALAGGFVCSLGPLARKREPFINPGFRVSPCFSYQPECCCWHFSLTADAVCVGFLLAQFI